MAMIKTSMQRKLAIVNRWIDVHNATEYVRQIDLSPYDLPMIRFASIGDLRRLLAGTGAMMKASSTVGANHALAEHNGIVFRACDVVPSVVSDGERVTL